MKQQHQTQFSLCRSKQLIQIQLIEKYGKTTRFCFIRNHISQIIPAVQSRCTRFKFKQIGFSVGSLRIKQICEKENIQLDDNAVRSVFVLCSDDMIIRMAHPDQSNRFQNI
ncbi:unnamed protein product [Paramecium sonneborni]|uniref:Uncharacterized protein n=1 Tax=Paramecium sonneborni TaxID=65129 RepID=A0A8S1PZN0_9CILI|nr:unnamed protein product [Paramecium sonneborni]